MTMRLARTIRTAISTIGELSIDGIFECFTLEDKDRGNGQKVWGKTAIPSGRYRVQLSLSNRFGKILPELLDVPRFVGVRIHGGNTARDTEGCILVGGRTGVDCLYTSDMALGRLIPKLARAETNGREIWLEIA